LAAANVSKPMIASLGKSPISPVSASDARANRSALFVRIAIATPDCRQRDNVMKAPA
jgi:hypothetical protein